MPSSRVIALLVVAALLVTAACRSEATPPVPDPAQQSPATQAPAAGPATPLTPPTLSPNPAPVAAVSPIPAPSPSPAPGPRPAASLTPPAASPTPAPVATVSTTPASPPAAMPDLGRIDVTMIKRVDPRPLPAGIALYYRFSHCGACGFGFGDLRRVVFDESLGEYREDRPLAFFDGEGNADHAGVSVGGQEIAAMVCHAGNCVAWEYWPSADAVQHAWLSPDAGRTWADLGPVLPGAEVVEVTGADVLVHEWNLFRIPGFWSGLTDAERRAAVARLASLGLDGAEEWESRYRWVVSGEVRGAPADARPPPLPWTSWSEARRRPSDGAVAWWGEVPGHHLLALAAESGTVEAVYGAVERLWWGWRVTLPHGPQPTALNWFATDVIMVREGTITTGERVTRSVVDVIDLAAAVIYEAEGLSLPFGPRPAYDQHYYLMTARPAPAIE